MLSTTSSREFVVAECCGRSADGGYYLFPECPSVAAVQLLTLNTTEQDEADDLTMSLMNWWLVCVCCYSVTER